MQGARTPSPRALGARGLPWCSQGSEAALTTGHRQPETRSRLSSQRGNTPGERARSQPGAKPRGAVGLATSTRASSLPALQRREGAKRSDVRRNPVRRGRERAARLFPRPRALLAVAGEKHFLL